MNRTPHIITYIRRSVLRKLWRPILLLTVSLLILSAINAAQFLFPVVVPEGQSYRPDQRLSSYITVTVSDLYYSGYDAYSGEQLLGHYYYTLTDGQMQVYLLQARLGKEAEPFYESLTFTGMLSKDDTAISMLILNLAEELDWTAEGLSNITYHYLVDESALYRPSQLIILGTAILGFFWGAIVLIQYLIYLCFPKYSPGFIRLHHYGNPEKIFRNVERELEEDCLIRTQDMALTKGYLVEFSGTTSAIVPLKSVLWAFHYGTLKHRRMYYTLHLVMETGDRYSFHNKSKEDLDVIMEQLSVHFPYFFIGYSEEHRQLVHHLLKERRKEWFQKIFHKK